MELGSPLSFRRGRGLKNRFALAPMTNQQSHADGSLSEDEFHWLTKRAEGGFGLTLTCATNVQPNGKTWPGQLGAFDDKHIDGLSRLATRIKEHGGHAALQLFHGGRRATKNLIDGPLRAPSNDAETGAVAWSEAEVEQLRDDFIDAAIRCDKAGFDSIEIHAAHGFAVCQFLSPQFNHRQDQYGGSAENRARLLLEIIEGIRDATTAEFAIGIRLSPERHGLDFQEMRDLTQNLMSHGAVDYIDMSMQNAFKEPEDKEFSGKSLAEWYLSLPRAGTRMGICGKIFSPSDIQKIAKLEPDFVVLGRAGIVHHNYPELMLASSDFEPRQFPLSATELLEEGASPTLVKYLETFPDFVRNASETTL